MSDPNNRGGKFVGFLAFCVTMFAAILYLVSFVLSFWNIYDNTIAVMQSVASVIMICIVSIVGWRFVKTRNIIWKTIYIIVLLAVVASVVIPVCLQFIPAAE
ncbi:MAG: hypothetical protein J1G02_03055 [Clostridiales bacterium]|nr:hypothetical protein [Clostridiales bacterium]